MSIATEPIGSIPRPLELIEAAARADGVGTCDDCGFSPFSDDTTTTRDTAFAKIRARVLGTAMAARLLEGA
jgi:5-methyltetrahydropteroyltriglutamate--homocysteine methyltransferase